MIMGVRSGWLLALTALIVACAGPTATVQPQATDRPTAVVEATASPQVRVPSTDLEASARELVDLLATGDFDRAVQQFDDKMREVLPADKLAESWASVVAQVGPYQRRLDARTEERQGYRLVLVTTEFAPATLDTQVAFDESGRIAGLFFVPSQAPAQPQAEPQEYYVAPYYIQPAAFEEREIVVTSGELLLPGTFSVPVGEGPFAVVLLVHGSGPHDRDETVGFNKPFRDLAWGLASQGIAVLRYEKRTRVYPDRVRAVQDTFTINDETVEDAVAAVSLLGKMKDVDSDRIFVLGHSLGGTAIPRIGALAPDADGFIVMAGATRPLEDLYLEQVSYVYELDGDLSDEESRNLAQIEKQVARVKDPRLSPDTPASELPLSVPVSYWLDLQGYDPAAAAKELGKPMLILQAERDYQVTVEDFEGWKAALALRDNVQFKLYPTLNHWFVEGEGRGTPAEDYTTPGHVAEFVISEIVEWIVQH